MAERKDSGSGHDEALGRLADELARLLDAREEPDLALLAQTYDVSAEEAAQCLRTVVLSLDFPNESSPEDAPAPGPLLPADYELLGELGQGGMGIVYRARQRSLDREVAVKVLRPGEQLFGGAIRRFRREAQSLARLRHPHVVAVHEVGEVEGAVFFSMDLIEGGSLAERLARERLTPAFALRLLQQVTSAIAYTHSKGIVHRDLKPANVLLDREDNAFVVDFGLARVIGQGAVTATGAIVGTPDYMSPEQARGETEAIGEPTDIYSLGAILYECLTGRTPFAGRGLVERIHAVVHEDPKPPRKLERRVPDDLERICLKAMAKEPERRYGTARALLEDLERFEQGRAVRARRPSLAYRARRLVRRRWIELGLGLSVALCLFLFARLWLEGDPLASRARQMLAAGELERAAVFFEAALGEARDPGERQAVVGKCIDLLLEEARSRELRGQPAAALAALERFEGWALDEEIWNAFVPHGWPAKRLELLWALGRLRLGTGDEPAALASFEALLESDPEGPETRPSGSLGKGYYTENPMVPGLVQHFTSSRAVLEGLLEGLPLLEPDHPDQDAAGLLFATCLTYPGKWRVPEADWTLDELGIAWAALLPHLYRIAASRLDLLDRVAPAPHPRLLDALAAIAEDQRADPRWRDRSLELLAELTDAPPRLSPLGQAWSSPGGGLPIRVVAALDALRQGGPVEQESALERWLVEHTGFAPPGTAAERSAAWRSWLAPGDPGEHQEQIRRSLGTALGLEPNPTPGVLFNLLHAELASAAEAGDRPGLRAFRAHQLLTLATPSGRTAPPWRSGDDPAADLLDRWLEVFPGIHGEPHWLRFAHLSIDPTDGALELLSQLVEPLRLRPSRELSVPSRSNRRVRVGFLLGSPGLANGLYPGATRELGCEQDAHLTLHFQADALFLKSTRVRHTGWSSATTTRIPARDGDGPATDVRLIQAVRPNAQEDGTAHVTLVCVERKGERPVPWSVGEWAERFPGELAEDQRVQRQKSMPAWQESFLRSFMRGGLFLFVWILLAAVPLLRLVSALARSGWRERWTPRTARRTIEYGALLAGATMAWNGHALACVAPGLLAVALGVAWYDPAGHIAGRAARLCFLLAAAADGAVLLGLPLPGGPLSVRFLAVAGWACLPFLIRARQRAAGRDGPGLLEGWPALVLAGFVFAPLAVYVSLPDLTLDLVGWFPLLGPLSPIDLIVGGVALTLLVRALERTAADEPPASVSVRGAGG